MRIMSFRTVMLAVAIASLSTAFADTTAKPAALSKDVGAMALHGVALSDAFASLSRATGQEILANWRALERIKITKSLPITADLSNLPLGGAMDQLLREVGGTQATLAYKFSDRALVVSTPEDLEANTCTRVYDIHRGIKDASTKAKDVEAITKRVLGIDPLSWQAAGGSIGSVNELSGNLIVTHTQRVQDRVARELADVLPNN